MKLTGDNMTTEYLAIYEQPLDPEIKEQIMRYCSDRPLAPVSDATLKNIEITCEATYERNIRLFWFQDPENIFALRFFDVLPIYIGGFDTQKLASFDSFQQSIERLGLLMCSASNLQDELDNHRHDLMGFYHSASPMIPPNIEHDIIDLLNESHKVMYRHIQKYFAVHQQ